MARNVKAKKTRVLKGDKEMFFIKKMKNENIFLCLIFITLKKKILHEPEQVDFGL
jgi:hypothetical protein